MAHRFTARDSPLMLETCQLRTGVTSATPSTCFMMSMYFIGITALPLKLLRTVMERVEVDQVQDRREDGPATAEVDAAAGMRAKLRQLLGALDELNPLTFREGPHTILERFLERTGQVLDLIAADTLESKRTVANIASFLRFAADWQTEHPDGTLATPPIRPCGSNGRIST